MIVEGRTINNIEEMLELPSPMSAADQARLRKTYSWEIVGPNPL